MVKNPCVVTDKKKRSIVLQPKIPSAETLWLEEDL